MSQYVTIIDGMTSCAAADLMGWAEALMDGEGVINIGTDPLKVVQRGAGANLSVDVGAGQCLVLRDAYVSSDNTQKFWHYHNTATVNVPIDSNSSGSTRIDKICVKIDTGATPNANADNVGSLIAVKGTPGGGAPATPDNHLLLATITIADSDTAIGTADIADSRSFVSVMAGSRAFVDGVDGATITFDLKGGFEKKFQVTLGGNRTIALSNAKVGQCFIIKLVQDGAGSRTVTWFTTIKWAGGVAPTLTTTLNKADVFAFIVTGSGTYDGFVIGQNI